MTPMRGEGSLSLSRDTDSRAALASLSQELDDLSKTLNKNLTYQDLRNMRNATNSSSGDHRSTSNNIGSTPTQTLDAVNSVDVSSLGSALELSSSAANRQGHQRHIGVQSERLNTHKTCKGRNGGQQQNLGDLDRRFAKKGNNTNGINEINKRNKGRGSSSNSIASMEQQTEYLNQLLQRTRNDRSNIGDNEKGLSYQAKPAAVNDSINRRATDTQQQNQQQEQHNRHRQREGSFKRRTTDDDESSPAQLQSPPFSFFSPSATEPSSSRLGDYYRADNSDGLAASRSRLFEKPSEERKEYPMSPPRPTNGATSRRPSSSSAALHNLKEILKAKDDRILYLEEENEFLRSLLLKLQQQQRQPQNLTTSAEGDNNSNHRSPKRETNSEGGMVGPRAEIFSPGTEFVAGLAELTDIDVGNHAPISFVIDKHWDKIMKGTGKENHD